jgi:hypothetical protein
LSLSLFLSLFCAEFGIACVDPGAELSIRNVGVGVCVVRCRSGGGRNEVGRWVGEVRDGRCLRMMRLASFFLSIVTRFARPAVRFRYLGERKDLDPDHRAIRRPDTPSPVRFHRFRKTLLAPIIPALRQRTTTSRPTPLSSRIQPTRTITTRIPSRSCNHHASIRSS